MMMARTKQTARVSTKTQGPPPPPPDPIPDERDPNIPKPSQNDLVKAMGKLKKTKANYNPVKVGRELFNSHHYTNLIDWHHDFMPLHHAKNALYSHLTAGDLVTIDLYGTDQVTDLFFKVILDFNLEFPSLTKLNLSGCVHLTDQGVKWMLKMAKGLYELLLQGCVNVTEKGLYEILTQFKSSVERTVDLKGSGVALIPIQPNADSRPSLKLAGCPLISPTLAKHVKYSHRYSDLKEHATLPLWKMLIFNRSIETYSLGHYLAEGYVQGVKETRKVWKNQSCSRLSDVPAETLFNIIEVKDYDECTELFITEACIVVLTCTAEEVMQRQSETVNHLTTNILSIYSKHPNTVVVVCPVDPSTEPLLPEDLDALQSASDTLLAALNENISAIHQNMLASYSLLMGETSTKTSKGFLESALHFKFQQEFGRLWQHADALESRKLLVQPVVMDTGLLPISRWVELAFTCVPWQAEFGSEMMDLAELMRRQKPGGTGEVKTGDYYIWYNKNFSWDRNIPLPAVWRGVSILANRGVYTEFPRRQHNPTLFDQLTMLHFLECLGEPTEVTDTRRPSVPCVGVGTLCWHEDSLAHEFLPMCAGNHGLARRMIRRLEKQNMLIQLPCKRDSKDQDGFVYVRHTHLPDEPPLPLEDFWPKKKPANMKQLERFYVLIHGMPRAFMTAVFRHLGKLFNFTLLWKEGVYFQSGAVDVLINLAHSDADRAPALVVAVRGEATTSSDQDHKTMDKHVWAVLKLAFTTVDYVLSKLNLFAKVLIGCQDCDSDRDTFTMLNTLEGGLLPITTAMLGVPGRYITCRGKCSENRKEKKRFLADEVHGPESERKRMVTPLHQQQFVDRLAEEGHFLSYSKCFLCDRCAESGIRCSGAGFSGKTSRHCSCSTKKTLCPECGICSRCTAFMAKMETTIMPGLSSGNPFRFVGKPQSSSDTNIFKGNCVNCNMKSVLLCSQPMSPEHFNYVDLTISRGNDLLFGLASGVTDTNLKKDNLLECCEIYYMLNTGKLKLPMVNKHSSKWVAKEGSHVAFCVRHPRQQANNMLIDWDGGELAVDVLLDGQCIHTTYVVTRTQEKVKPQALFPIVVVNTPSSFFLNTPGIWSVTKQKERVELTPGQVVEYSVTEWREVSGFVNNTKTCKLALVSEGKKNSGTKTVTISEWYSRYRVLAKEPYAEISEDLYIHPLGFHTTKGYDLEVEMPVYKGTTKEIQSYRTMKLKMGDPEFEKLLENFQPADFCCFSQNQINGTIPHKSQTRYTLETDCSRLLTYPAVLYCRLAQLKTELDRLLFKQGDVSLSGAAGVVLPLSVPSVPDGLDVDQRVCLQSALQSTGQMHPLCHIRASASETLLMPAKYELTEHSAPYGLVHFVNTRGIQPGPTQTHRETVAAIWSAYMALLNKVELPEVYSEMFGGDLARIPRTSLCEWIHKHLLLAVHRFLARLPNKLTADTLPLSDRALLEEAAQEMRVAVEGSHVMGGAGLVRVTPSFVENEEDYLLMCAAHSNTILSPEKHKLGAGFPVALFTNYSHFVRCLELPQVGLRELQPEFFLSFPNLVHLDVSNNKLTSLSPLVVRCTNMLYLTLCYNQLTDLPLELASLSSLKRLDISGNPMKVLPSVVTQLTNLAKLYAMHLLLEKLPKDIGTLAKLEVLGLNGNCLRSLPGSIRRLTKLEHLSLNGVEWLDGQGSLVSYNAFKRDNFPGWFKEHSLDPAELFTNGTPEGYVEQDVVADINTKLYRIFPRLGSNPIQQDDKFTLVPCFPQSILCLTSLQYLSLQYQGFVSLPPGIDRLTQLHDLILSHCPLLETLPAELGSLTLVKRLVISECPSLKTPPKEIQARGPDAIMAYLRRLQTGSVSCRRTKLMMVGLGGAGKTSLVKAMMSTEMKANLISGEQITDGIDISSWSVGGDEEEVTFSVWDFAGQTVYYNTHQFFLSNRAIYLLLWNMRLGYEHAGLDFWLNSISVHAPKAPVFVVGSHADQVSKWELPIEKMKQQYPCIQDFLFVSSFSGQGVSETREALHKCALQQPYMGESISEVWLNFEKAIVQKRETESVVSYEEVERIATETGIFEKIEISGAVQFLHELGTLQHFNNEYLKDKVVVDPQWIVDVMACVVSVKDSTIKNGKLHHADVGRVWADYPESLHKWLLRLTEEYDLTFPLPDKPINLVPCLLPEKHDAVDWPEVKVGQGVRETKMLYKFVYLPAGLFNRAQVRLYQYSNSSLIWKTGSVLRKNGNLGLVTQTRDSELLVRVQGPRPENVLFLVHEVFEGLISESFQGVSYDYQIPCPDCLSINTKEVFLFSASNIKRATELKVPFLQCTRHFHAVTLTDLHSIMPPDSHTEYDFHLASAVRGLTDLRKDLKTDIYISYCQDDLSENQTVKVVDPRDVYKDLTSKGFKCYFPEAGSQVNLEQQALAMRDCKVFMALVSDSYVVDAGCVNLFLYARMTMNKPLLMVVLGQGKHWRTSKLGILLAGEVFVNMTQPERYSVKVEELVQVAGDRTSQTHTNKQYPPCFISYSWANSHQAVEKGSRKLEGALGYADPRQLKDYLEEHQVKTWIDIEQVGKVGLFEDISEGLQHARVLVACVSDQYANSSNCTMEFRFATNVLKIPTVLAVVGTGNQWRKSEVGMLSLQGPLPEINFQDRSEGAHERLLQMVRAHIPTETEGEAAPSGGEKSHQEGEETTSLSFQELFELAQRKFLRQVSRYSEDSVLYPRLIVIDFLQMLRGEMEEGQDGAAATTSPGRPGLQRRATSTGNRPLKHRDLGFKILCEHEEGWHSYADPISAPPEFDEAQLGRFSPYLSRILSLLRHSNQLLLNCVAGEEGQTFIKWMEELPQSSDTDFGQVYKAFREEVIRADKDLHMGQLARCHLPSGKTIWLCPEHQAVTRMTLLTDDVVLPGERHTVAARDAGMAGSLHALLSAGNLDGWSGREEGEEEEEEGLADPVKAEVSTDNPETRLNMADLVGVLEHTKQMQAKRELHKPLVASSSAGKLEPGESFGSLQPNTTADNIPAASSLSFGGPPQGTETSDILHAADSKTRGPIGQNATGSNGLFGQSGNTDLFGQNDASNTGLFGQSNTGNTSLFGQSNTGNTSLFGQSNTGNRSLFGQNNTDHVNGNLFGQRNTSTFGQENTDAFGKSNTATVGQNNSANTVPFGQSATRTPFSFGQNNAANTAPLGQSITRTPFSFGQNNAANTVSLGQSDNGSSFSFGQNNAANTAPLGQSDTGSSFSFGQNNAANTVSFGQSITGSVFGSRQNNAANTGPFRQSDTRTSFSFGQNNSANSFQFGQSNSMSSESASEGPLMPSPPEEQDSRSRRRAALVRERSKQNLERERTKEQIRAITSATLRAAQADQPHSQACTLL